jgi:hypothetical protein
MPIENSPLYQCTDGATSDTFDSVPVDYKRISVEALKVGTPTILTKLSSNAAAKAAETPSNTGMLLVKVTNAQGAPVSDATVTVTNPGIQISLIGHTNDQGYVFVSGMMPEHQNGYHIVATKNGYSMDFTTSRTAQNPNQVQPDVDINIQQVTVQTLRIDILANMAVTMTNETGTPLAGQNITATSDKITATNPDTPKNIYNQTTDANGVATFTNIEWDSYTLSTAGNYYVVAVSPYQPFAVDPNTTLPVSLVVTTNGGWPRITSVSPASGTVGSIVTVVINGFNLEGNTTVVLRKSGSADVIPTSTSVDPNKKSVTVTFDLTNVSAGNWDLILTSEGRVVTEIEGFTIT